MRNSHGEDDEQDDHPDSRKTSKLVMAPHTKAQQAQQVCSNKHGFSAKAPGIIAASAAQDKFERQLQETREREKRMLEFREYRMTQLSFSFSGATDWFLYDNGLRHERVKY